MARKKPGPKPKAPPDDPQRKFVNKKPALEGVRVNGIGQPFAVGRQCPNPLEPFDSNPQDIVGMKAIGSDRYEVTLQDGKIIHLVPGMQAVFQPDKSWMSLDGDETDQLTNLLYRQGRGIVLSVPEGLARDALVERAMSRGQLEPIQAAAKRLITKRKAEEHRDAEGEPPERPEEVYEDGQGNVLSDADVEGPPADFLAQEATGGAAVVQGHMNSARNLDLP